MSYITFTVRLQLFFILKALLPLQNKSHSTLFGFLVVFILKHLVISGISKDLQNLAKKYVFLSRHQLMHHICSNIAANVMCAQKQKIRRAGTIVLFLCGLSARFDGAVLC